MEALGRIVTGLIGMLALYTVIMMPVIYSWTVAFGPKWLISAADQPNYMPADGHAHLTCLGLTCFMATVASLAVAVRSLYLAFRK